MNACDAKEPAMTSLARYPFLRATEAAWRDAWTAAKDMNALVAIAFLAFIAFGAVQYLTPWRQFGEWYLRFGKIGLDIVVAYLATPLAIAVQRHVLLGETTRVYSLNPLRRPFLRFFGFAAVLSIVASLTGMTGAFLVDNASTTFAPLVGARAAQWLALPVFLLFIGVALAVAAVLLRSLVLFAAIAVAAPHASFRNAMADAKGYSLDTLLVVIAAVLPIAVITGLTGIVVIAAAAALLAGMFAHAGSLAGTMAGWTAVTIQAAYTVALVCVLAAVVSRLYQAIADRLGRPPNLRAADAMSD